MKKKSLIAGLVLIGVLAAVFFLTVSEVARFMEGGGAFDQKLALVRIEGVIMDSRETLEELKRHRDNPSIKAVVLRVDSPGGAVVPSQEIYEEVKKSREKGKKIVVSMGTVAASGGYYIASAADRIVANPGTITGSIGVIMELANIEGLMKKIGVESLTIKSGEHKDIGSPFREMKEEDRRIIQDVLDDVHSQFIEAVSQGRGIAEEKIRPIADGRIFTGRQAKELGLVDELGDLQDAIRVAADMIGIKGEPTVVEKRKRFSLVDLLKNQFPGHVLSGIPWGGGISLKYLLAY